MRALEGLAGTTIRGLTAGQRSASVGVGDDVILICPLQRDFGQPLCLLDSPELYECVCPKGCDRRCDAALAALLEHLSDGAKFTFGMLRSPAMSDANPA